MTIRGALLDLEGVLYQDDAPIEGAIEAVVRLRRAGLGLRFLTNITTRPCSDIVQRMDTMGFRVEPAHVFSAAMAAGRLLQKGGVRRVHLAAPRALAEDFSAFELVDEAPEAVVVGDLYKGFTWDLLNRLFRMVRDGARLIALHKNRYCRRAEGIALDLGPFVATLEYGAGITAELVGKPSPAFFALALDDLGLGAAEVVMVGDDLEADIVGAQRAGLRAAQVETGKYTPRDRDHPEIKPDALLSSVRELPTWIERLA